MSTPEEVRNAEAMADAFFDWAKAKGILRIAIEDPAVAFMAGATAAWAWVLTPEGRPWLHTLEGIIAAAEKSEP